jgi:hypothetical protein
VKTPVQTRARSGWPAYASAVLFLALFISAGLSAPGPVSPFLGLVCHLIVLPLVAAWPAPAWARAAGYGWLIIDVATNVAAWNLAPLGLTGAELHLTNALFAALRQGIHVSASVWIATASWTATSALRPVGLGAALFLTAFALAGPWLPAWFIYPGYALLVAWFALLGRQLPRLPRAAPGP